MRTPWQSLPTPGWSASSAFAGSTRYAIGINRTNIELSLRTAGVDPAMGTHHDDLDVAAAVSSLEEPEGGDAPRP